MKKIQKEYLRFANSIKELSTCSRLSVGAILTTEDHYILSTGYNGAPTNLIHCNIINKKKETPCRCIHAEQNALTHSLADFRLNKILYVTTFPCFQCSKLLIANNVKIIYYINDYRNMEKSFNLLKEAGVEVINEKI